MALLVSDVACRQSIPVHEQEWSLAREEGAWPRGIPWGCGLLLEAELSEVRESSRKPVTILHQHLKLALQAVHACCSMKRL